MKINYLLILLTICILSGCAIIPGSHLSTNGKNIIEQDNINTDDIIDIYPLNATILDTLKEKPSVAKSNPLLDKQIKNYEYRFGVGDVLNITVWNHPELTIPADSYRSASETGNWVHSDGTIFYPYIGRVYVVGKTVDEVRNEVSQRLSKYIESPQIDINIAAFRSKKIYVSGAILKPGAQPITNIPLTLLDAFNQAGGLTDNADWNNVILTRNGKETPISIKGLIQYGDLTQNQLMLPGDILYLPRNDNLKIFVMGEVNRPTMLKIDRDGMSLTEALRKGEGLNQDVAEATGVFVIRSKSNQANAFSQKIADIYQLDMSDATALVIGTEFKLKPYDVVYVTAAPVARWNRLIKQLIPTITGFNDLSEGTRRIRHWTN